MIHIKCSIINLLTFNVDFCWGGVCAIKVGGKARVSACVFFKSLCYDQRVSLTIGDDLNIRTVFQLFTLTKPPGKHNQNVTFWTGTLINIQNMHKNDVWTHLVSFDLSCKKIVFWPLTDWNKDKWFSSAHFQPFLTCSNAYLAHYFNILSVLVTLNECIWTLSCRSLTQAF